MKGIDFIQELRAAIREGRKTVTRRLMRPQPIPLPPFTVAPDGTSLAGVPSWPDGPPRPRYCPGEVVYVREPWFLLDAEGRPAWEWDDGCVVVYRDDNPGKVPCDGPDRIAWRPARFMPARAARTRIRILDVRPERLQDITEEECVREGLGTVALFALTWNTIHKDPGTTWVASPWVWRIEFEVVS